MAHHKSAIKRIRQNEIRRERNKARRTIIRNHIKAVRKALGEKDLNAAQEAYAKMVPVVDRMAHRNIIARNTAARMKSRLNRHIHTLVNESK